MFLKPQFSVLDLEKECNLFRNSKCVQNEIKGFFPQSEYFNTQATLSMHISRKIMLYNSICDFNNMENSLYV